MVGGQPLWVVQSKRSGRGGYLEFRMENLLWCMSSVDSNEYRSWGHILSPGEQTARCEQGTKPDLHSTLDASFDVHQSSGLKCSRVSHALPRDFAHELNVSGTTHTEV